MYSFDDVRKVDPELAESITLELGLHVIVTNIKPKPAATQEKI